MASFDKAYFKVIKNEGGYVRDKDDKGGETYLGIARRFHKNSPMWPIIDEITKANPTASYTAITSLLKRNNRIDTIVKNIYKTEYWDKLNCDNIRSQKIAEQFFDMAVNAGTSTAVKLMQKLMSIEETGHISDKFITELNDYSNRRRYRKV